MLFNNTLFLFVFLPVACALFYALARWGRTPAVVALLAASLVCYAPWGWWPTALLFSSITANFIIGFLLGGPRALPPGRVRTRLYAIGQVANVVVLIWFKYQIIQAVLHGLVSPTTAFIFSAIPAGISFYTFHQAAFLADAYNREATVVRLMERVTGWRGGLAAYVRYAAFVSFFPQLVIGPITYLKEFYPQIERKTFGRIKLVDLEVGLTLIAIGLFKKLVLADNLEPLSSQVFEAAHISAPMGTGTAWLGVFSYYLQLYFDFSGYSDAAIGLARLFGLRYPMNFYSPLKAVGIIDFYRRWHMTLTRVIARFVYTPLSLSGTRTAMRRRLPKPARRALGVWLPLLLNFEIIALWHGAHVTFILFGVLHGAWYVTETEVRASAAFKRWRRASSERLRTLLGRALFVIPMALTFALFRSESFEGFGRLLGVLSGLDSSGPLLRASLMARAIVLIGLAIVYLAPNSMQLMQAYRPGIYTYEDLRTDRGSRRFRWRPSWGWALSAGCAMLLVIYYGARQAPFLYQGF